MRRNGFIGGNGNLTLSHDAANQDWGGSWRIPTQEEIKELVANTTTEWTSRNGVNGYLIKSKKNGNTMFLPAAGCLEGSSLNYTGVSGNYWNSTPDKGSSVRAYCLCNSLSDLISGWGSRCVGRSVRPVSE